MTNTNDLIRRGDALDAMCKGPRTVQERIDIIRALPAVAASQPVQAQSSCPHPTSGDETYYTRGKTADWFVSLNDADFAEAICFAAQDLNDTGLGDDLDKWMPFQVMLSDAADRIKRFAASQTADPVTNADSRQRVTVKPLVWDGLVCVTEYKYCLSYWEKEDVFVDSYTTMRRHPTLEAAKAAAQADYEARTLAAIDVQPDPRDAQIAALMEALEAADCDANKGAMTSTYSEGSLRGILRTIRDRSRAALAAVKGENK